MATDERFPLAARRRAAVEVAIGKTTIGGTRPIAVQSMTTTRTADAAATAAQVCALARAGCDIVRVTVPAKPDAEALPEIRRIMKREGVDVPLVADIHFTPSLALKVVEFVDKVRVNPGNFADRKNVGGQAYDEARWNEDVARLAELFAPLVDRAKALGVALRIGANHGSLSDRIVQRHGDSPAGMVESALEFVRIAEDRGHRGLVISMKASNPQVMVRAYRLLARRLDEEQLGAYPLHLGVTEAGGGDDGRIKSAAGIGALLADGLGDTIRVSLTEDPLNEVPAGREIVRLHAVAATAEPERLELTERRDPCVYARRSVARVEVGGVAYGADEPPRVEATTTPADGRAVAALLAARPAIEMVDVLLDDPARAGEALATLKQLPQGGPARGVTLAGAARRLVGEADFGRALRAGADRVGLVYEPERDDPARLAEWAGLPLLLLLPADGPLAVPGAAPRGGRADATARDGGGRADATARVGGGRVAGTARDGGAAASIVDFARRVAGCAPRVMVGLVPGARLDVVGANRLLAAALDAAGARLPLVVSDRPAAAEDPRLGFAGRVSSLFIDGLGDALRVPAGAGAAAAAKLAHDVLQASRRRLERAEFIACPSCGRTLFDLVETTRRVQALTAHLKLKIGVMGCVVNGPGEMADADYGYVGWGEGKVALFVGRTMVERDIPSADAPARLVELIKSRGQWTDPPAPASR